MSVKGKAAAAAAAVVAAAAWMPAAALADCRDDFNEVWNAQEEVRSHLEDELQQDLRTLRQAAAVMDRRDRDDACEELTEAVDDMLKDERRRLEKEGVILSRTEKERRARYAAAQPLIAQGSAVAASALVGVELRNRAGEKLGEVKDLLVDPARNNASWLIVERGGFLGLGENTAAVPADRLAVTRDNDTVLIDMPKEQFENAPELKERKWLFDPAWRDRNAAFYRGAQPQGAPPPPDGAPPPAR